MPEFDEASVELAAAFSQTHAGFSLLPAQAKLYSHFTRIRAGRRGLPSWSELDTQQRLSEALRLLQAALTQREVQHPEWKRSLKRAAEILEWLFPTIRSQGIPADLLAAAAYQLAGYPASAAGLLRHADPSDTYSRPLYSLLSSDFASIIPQLAVAWQDRDLTRAEAVPTRPSEETPDEVLTRLVVGETLGTLGVIGAFLRWGDTDRLEAAQQRLEAVSDLMLRSADGYSWILAKLVSQIAQVISRSALRRFVEPLLPGLTDQGRKAMDLYVRRSFLSGRALAWPSQMRGIERLISGGSFALCTPTGSGKTAVAELAIIQSLFSNGIGDAGKTLGETQSPISIYITPSRSLASEVERKLEAVFRELSTPRVVVTGLYGGIDWGPTDAWLTSDQPVVLICTHEKAEALLRFVGPLFVKRLRLIVVDEAHTVQLSGKDTDIPRARSLSLESLVMRLLSYNEEPGQPRRIIALSAVAGGVEEVLAKWISGDETATAVTEPYRSTRQLIGRLELSRNRTFEIQYDLLDRSRLVFPGGGAQDTPWIPQPIPPLPFAGKWDSGGPEKSIRPALLWAALHFSTSDESRRPRAVLIYLPQQPEYVARDFLEILTTHWADQPITHGFAAPDNAEDLQVWQQCLACTADYFGTASNEYRLLIHGIVLHHGRLPGLMSRLLVQLIDRRIINVVVATSTLAEGVNLPFETVLLGSLRRRGNPVAASELANVIGRAGRPGFGTEGRALVVLGQASDYNNDRLAYRNLLTTLAQALGTSQLARSPLAELIKSIRTRWQASTAALPETFASWLEEVSVTDLPSEMPNTQSELAAEVDALDKTLLAAITELEALDPQSSSSSDMEEKLAGVWRRSFAHYASAEEQNLGDAFVRRGVALEQTIYPDAGRRRRLYMSSIAPAAAQVLVDSFSEIKELLVLGFAYGGMSRLEQFDFVRTAVGRFSQMPMFRMEKAPSRTSWEEVLGWWLRAPDSPAPISAVDASRWYQYASSNFLWKFAWGLGSFIALAINETHHGELRRTELQEWPETGLPWSVFWLKEIVNWGTLDPVAAYLLSRQVRDTREDAEALAQTYYTQPEVISLEPNDRLNASRIRDWAAERLPVQERSSRAPVPTNIPSVPLRDFTTKRTKKWRVIPVERAEAILWCDPAGYPLATSERHQGWNSQVVKDADFVLDASDMIVRSSAYLLPTEEAIPPVWG